jgi:hypothetical protein
MREMVDKMINEEFGNTCEGYLVKQIYSPTSGELQIYEEIDWARFRDLTLNMQRAGALETSINAIRLQMMGTVKA